MKYFGLTEETRWKLYCLSLGGGAGIFGVGVKFVEIRKNIGGEGELLAID